jgi:cytochrome b561
MRVMARWRNSTEGYGIISQAFHWSTAVLVFVQLGLGLYAASLPVSLARLVWLSRHKSLGLAVLALVLLRLVWRACDRPPALPQHMPPWERRVALANHCTLYVLLVLAAMAGWAGASAAGLSINWFGLFPVPDLMPRNPSLAHALATLHAGLVTALALLVLAHVGAAARHAWVLRDGIVRRMLPRQGETK